MLYYIRRGINFRSESELDGNVTELNDDVIKTKQLFFLFQQLRRSKSSHRKCQTKLQPDSESGRAIRAIIFSPILKHTSDFITDSERDVIINIPYPNPAWALGAWRIIFWTSITLCIGDLDKLSLVLWFGSGLKNYFYNDSTVSKSVIHCKK